MILNFMYVSFFNCVNDYRVSRLNLIFGLSGRVFPDEINIESVDSVKQTALPSMGWYPPVYIFTYVEGLNGVKGGGRENPSLSSAPLCEWGHLMSSSLALRLTFVPRYRPLDSD